MPAMFLLEQNTVDVIYKTNRGKEKEGAGRLILATHIYSYVICIVTWIQVPQTEIGLPDDPGK